MPEDIPACGANNVTYDSVCSATCTGGVAVARAGACEAPAPPLRPLTDGTQGPNTDLPTSRAQSSSSGGLSSGALVGIIVGCVGGALLLAAALSGALVWHSRRMHQRQEEEQQKELFRQHQLQSQSQSQRRASLRASGSMTHQLPEHDLRVQLRAGHSENKWAVASATSGESPRTTPRTTPRVSRITSNRVRDSANSSIPAVIDEFDDIRGVAHV